jgi:hypothetical protein
MGQRAHRKVVHTGLGDRPGDLQREPAGRLQPGAAGDLLTAALSWATSMLSSRISWAPASTAITASATVSTSTSTGMSG